MLSNIAGGCEKFEDALSNLQKELQEKDIRREKICGEIVSQTVEVDAFVKSYSHEFEQAKAQMNMHMDLIVEEKNLLEYRIEERQGQEVATADIGDLQDRVEALLYMLDPMEQGNLIELHFQHLNFLTCMFYSLSN